MKSIMGVSERGQAKVLCCLPSNQLECLSFIPTAAGTNKDKDTALFESQILPFDGHRNLVRGLDFSSDQTAILSASGDAFKLWNRATLSCILTISHEHPVVSCKFCPGDRHFVAGTTDGHLILGDISTGTINQTESVGTENIWSIDILSNNMGFIASCGNFVQIYDFQIEDGKLKFELQRQMDVQESILCVKASRDRKYLVLGLLDSTVKVFYLDTFKFHLSMYGHTLPVVSLDISHDNTLVVSCSGDKTVKVWGLDFGDCHCSLIHTEGLVGCCFIDKTHLIASVAKDSVNIYDADSHTRVQTIKGHEGGGATAMGNVGFLIASAGRDQALRIFQRTQEILVLDDERELEREEELTKESRVDDTGLVSLATADGEKWADRVIEAIDLYKDSNASQNPIFIACEATDQFDFLYKSLSNIKSAELQQSIMMLPVSYVEDLVPALREVLERYPLSIELIVRCIAALIKFHLVTIRSLDANVVGRLVDIASSKLRDLDDMVLVNKSALELLFNDECEKEEEQTFREMAGERKRRRKKKEKALKRAVLLL